jgi:hypothetical protein
MFYFRSVVLYAFRNRPRIGRSGRNSRNTCSETNTGYWGQRYMMVKKNCLFADLSNTGSSTNFSHRHQMELGGDLHAPAALPLGGTHILLGRLGGTHILLGWCGEQKNHLPLPAVELLFPRSSSLVPGQSAYILCCHFRLCCGLLGYYTM